MRISASFAALLVVGGLLAVPPTLAYAGPLGEVVPGGGLPAHVVLVGHDGRDRLDLDDDDLRDRAKHSYRDQRLHRQQIAQERARRDRINSYYRKSPWGPFWGPPGLF